MAGYNEQPPNELSKYYFENMPYKVFPQNQQPNNWQSPHRMHAPGSSLMEETQPNRIKPQVSNNPMGPDYYYEEAYRNRGQQPYNAMPPVYNGQANHAAFQAQQPMSPVHEVHPAEEAPKKVEVVHKEVISTTTAAPTAIVKDDHNHEAKTSHRKVEKLSAEPKFKEVSVVEIDGHNTSPSGAILSLTLGLCITALMLVLVGCRMKMVRKRIRRGGKSSYAHDADFLVNGMYL